MSTNRRAWLFLLLLGVSLAGILTSRATLLVVPNADFSDTDNDGSIQGTLLNGGETAEPLGSGPWNAQTSGLVGLLLPPTASIGGGTASITGLQGLGGIGQSNSAQFYQMLSGQSYGANILYTLTVSIDAGGTLNLTTLTDNGIGIALTRGGNTNVMADSSTANPSFVSLNLVSGTVYDLSLQFLTNGTPPTGDIGIRLFAGVNAPLATVNLLGSADFDNVRLDASIISEPSMMGLLAFGFAIPLITRRFRKR